jgi:hypothetical protein
VLRDDGFHGACVERFAYESQAIDDPIHLAPVVEDVLAGDDDRLLAPGEVDLSLESLQPKTERGSGRPEIVLSRSGPPLSDLHSMIDVVAWSGVAGPPDDLATGCR